MIAKWLRKLWKKSVESEQPFGIEYRIHDADGQVRWVYEGGTGVFGEDGKLQYLDGAIFDITERRLADEALRESESRYRTLFDSANDAIFIMKDDMFVACNQKTMGMFGYTQEQIIGKKPYEFSPPTQPDGKASKEKAQRKIRAALAGEPQYFEWQHTRGDSTLFDAEVSLNLVELNNVMHIQAIVRDITDRKRTENEMVQLRNQLKNIIDSMPSLIMTVNPEGKVTHWNTQAELRTGISAELALGRFLPDVFPQLTAGLERVRDTIANKKPHIDTKVPQTVDHQTRYQDITVYPLIANGVGGAVIRVDDVTERVRMEEMVIQSEKMLSVGGLAAGMAHEINNPLAGIMQNVDLVLRRLTEDIPANLNAAAESGTDMVTIRAYIEKRDLTAYLGDVHKAGARASVIVKNMLKSDWYGNRSGIVGVLFHYQGKPRR